MDKKENKNSNRPSGQRWRKNHRNGGNMEKNATQNDDKAGPCGAGNRKRKNNNHTFEVKHPIGYKTLETVINTVDNDAELILKLSSRMNGFLVLLDQPKIRSHVMCLILAALARASKSSTELDTIQLLVHFFMEIMPKLKPESNFHRELKLFIGNLSTQFAPYSPDPQKYIVAVENLLTFLRRLQLTVYQKSFDSVRDLMLLITAQIDFINRKGNTLNEYIIDTMAQLNDSVDNFEQMKDETEQTEILLEPPEDFRRIGIYPDTFDILNNHEPFIRANIVEGKYVMIDHYLDVQFRLLREDFVRPLRSGIIQYRDIKSKPETMRATKFRINDLNIYQNVQIIGSKMVHSDQVHFCKFDTTPFKNIRWQVSVG